MNDAADALLATGANTRLHVFADRILELYLPMATRLPNAPHSRARLVPESIPDEFLRMHGGFGKQDLLLRVQTITRPAAVILSWGHMRHAIFVYATPPSTPPAGSFVREVDDRTYVIANES